jgi:hypothetical protein
MMCRVIGLPVGRAVPEGFAIRVADRLSDQCTNGLDVPTHESFAICTFSSGLGEGSYPLATSLDGATFQDSMHEAPVGVARLVCSQEACTTPITMQSLGGRDLTRRPLLLIVDTARLVADGTLKPDCSDLRVRNFDLSRDLAIWLEEGTCGRSRTIVWVLDPLWGPVDAEHERFSELYVLHGNADWQSQSDRNALFPFFALGTSMWLKADTLDLADGAALSEWADTSDGADRPATQSDSGARPVFRAGTSDSFPVVEFDGVDDRMVVPSMIAQSEASVFVVYRNDASGDTAWPRLVSAGTAGQNDYETGVAVFPELGSDNRPLPFPDGAVASAWSPGVRELGSFTIASGFEGGAFFQGGIAEVLMFDADVGWHTGREVESYLSVKYRLLEGLPTATVEYDQTRDICEDGVGPIDPGTGGAPPGTDAAATDDGCGCRLPAQREPSGRWLALGLAALALALRRNRRTR